MSKLARQVTETLYAELRAHKMFSDLGEQTQELNGLPLYKFAPKVEEATK